MSSPLTNDQKRQIGMLAHAAWQACPERESLLESNPELSASAVEAAWRHVEQGNHTTIDVRPDWAAERFMQQEQTVTRVLKGSPVPSWEGYESEGYSVVPCDIVERSSVLKSSD